MSRLQTPIRKNDNVQVTTGKDRGKKGRVIRVLPEKNRLIVEGVNLIKRHTRPNPAKNIKGGVVQREASLHASNVQLVCPECGVSTRVGHKVLADGRKVRICRKCEGVVDKGAACKRRIRRKSRRPGRWRSATPTRWPSRSCGR
jgi:large subunit ribosomal protein L24